MSQLRNLKWLFADYTEAARKWVYILLNAYSDMFQNFHLYRSFGLKLDSFILLHLITVLFLQPHPRAADDNEATNIDGSVTHD